jgi:nucleoside-diphosphate-sugar epimerase
MRAVITGGAGFVGSHLCERMVAEGWDVVCLDSLLTGSTGNLATFGGDPRFTFERSDITEPIRVTGPVDRVLHLASPASPADYLGYPIKTLKVGALGTLHALGLAMAKGARFVLASTAEVYGDPRVHPQPEGYWGNVNPVGPRSVYDEAKRYAEALAMAYHRTHGLSVGIVRIFNTYGERMRADDGRAVPTFIRQALAGESLTVHGDGSQTRSLCYISDLVEGIWRLTVSDLVGPVNIGDPNEITIAELAARIRSIAESPAPITFTERPEDDPDVRRPDITLARRALRWEPTVPLGEGLARTIAWARSAWSVQPTEDAAAGGSPQPCR